MKNYYIYIITNKLNGTLYIGVTSNLEKRISEHKNKLIKGFSAKYNLKELVYYEDFSDIENAITREKELKSWRREKKVELIESLNKSWKDLSLEWL